LWKHDLEIEDICCANDRFLSKMTPILRAKSTVTSPHDKKMPAVLTIKVSKMTKVTSQALYKKNIEIKKKNIVSILLLIDTVRGYN